MPLLDLYLFSLWSSTPRFVSTLRTGVGKDDIVAISKPRFLYIPASEVDAAILNKHTWDVLLLLNSNVAVPDECRSMARQIYRLSVGVPGKLLAAYTEKNAKLRAEMLDVPLTGSLDIALENHSVSRASGGSLELSNDLLHFMQLMEQNGEGKRPMSMLNLLRFREGGRDDYIKYGQGFQQAGGRRGGNAKIVGAVVTPKGEEKKWDEMSFVHYPSIRHFCDMTAGEDYQEINQKYRLGALKDTLLLCTTETDTLGQWQEIGSKI